MGEPYLDAEPVLRRTSQSKSYRKKFLFEILPSTLKVG